jgi:hypothetical protein
MSIPGFRKNLSWLVCIAVLLAVSASCWAQENKNDSSSPSSGKPASAGRSAPEQHSAPSGVQRPSHVGNGPRPDTAGQHPGTVDRGTPNSSPRGSSGKPESHASGMRDRPGTTERHGTPGASASRSPNAGRRSADPSSRRPVDAASRREPARTVRNIGGQDVGYDRRGNIRTIKSRGGATIYHGPHNNIRVVRVLPGGGRVVYSGRNYGRGYRIRTYYEYGHYRAVVYRPYYWRGRPYYVYAPYYYYPPAYYGWVYNPWVVPVTYRWAGKAIPGIPTMDIISRPNPSTSQLLSGWRTSSSRKICDWPTMRARVQPPRTL